MEIQKEIFLQSENLILRALNEKDIEHNYGNWLNDQEIVRYNSHGRFPQTTEKLLNFVKSSQVSSNSLVLAIIDKKSNQHIGNISLQDINWVDRSAEIAFLLGEKEFWGKGVMFEAGIMIIQHGFMTLNLHRIYCGTSSANLAMQKLALKLGMQQEGIRKEALFKEGKYHDIIEYGLLKKL